MSSVRVTIYGASDDLIEIEGDLREEFDTGGDLYYLAFSDGTVLSIEYTDAGVWRIHRRAVGLASFAKVEGDPDGDYTDRVTLDGDLSWVVVGLEFERIGTKPPPGMSQHSAGVIEWPEGEVVYEQILRPAGSHG